MFKWILVLVLVLGLIAVPAIADNILTEVEDVVVKQVETSALIGNAGPALGLFWPIKTIEKLDVTIGPMVALGTEAFLGGVGAQLPLDITVLGIEAPVNYAFVAAAYFFSGGDWEECAGVGKTFEVTF